MDKLIREAERSGDTRKLLRLRLRIDPEICPKCQTKVSCPDVSSTYHCCCMSCWDGTRGQACKDCPWTNESES